MTTPNELEAREILGRHAPLDQGVVTTKQAIRAIIDALTREQPQPEAPGAVELDKARDDQRLYGTGYMLDGKRVAPERIQVLPTPPAPVPAGSDGAVAYSAQFRASGDWSDYPMGTRAYSVSGGHWERVPGGWKWCTGSTFPTPGADAFRVAVPVAATPPAPVDVRVAEAMAEMRAAILKLDGLTRRECWDAYGRLAVAVDSALLSGQQAGVDDAMVERAHAAYKGGVPSEVGRQMMRAALHAALGGRTIAAHQ